MISELLAMLGQDRTFELLEFLIILFVLLSAATLVVVAVHTVRTNRTERRTNRRIEDVVRFLGRNIFGDEGWQVIEQTAAADGRHIDSLLSAFDVAEFDQWSSEAVKQGVLTAAEVESLRTGLNRPPELTTIPAAQPDESVIVPALGMPIAVSQGGVQARGTIAEVAESSFTVWVLNRAEELVDGEPASFLLLSRSGPYQFDATMYKGDDDTLVVARPARIVRTQRRRFGRRPAALPAVVRPYLGDGESRRVVINDLSGGGASVANPGMQFSTGNVVELAFSAGGNEYVVAGRVVRTSNDGHNMHVRFEAMKDQERHEIAESVATVALSSLP